MFYVYIIKSINFNWYYVGSTEDIEKRIHRHNSGDVASTKSRRPYILVYSEKYDTIQEARAREKKMKQNRSIKQDIIKNLALSSNG